jgi:hypothetical protein
MSVALLVPGDGDSFFVASISARIIRVFPVIDTSACLFLGGDTDQLTETHTIRHDTTFAQDGRLFLWCPRRHIEPVIGSSRLGITALSGPKLDGRIFGSSWQLGVLARYHPLRLGQRLLWP